MSATTQYNPNNIITRQPRGIIRDGYGSVSPFLDFKLVDLIVSEGQQQPVRVALTQSPDDEQPQHYLIDGNHRLAASEVAERDLLGFEPEPMDWHTYLAENALANYNKLAEAQTTKAQRQEMVYSFYSGLLQSGGTIQGKELTAMFESPVISKGTINRMFTRITKASKLEGFQFPPSYIELLPAMKAHEGQVTLPPVGMVLKQQEKLDQIGDILSECNDATLSALPDYLKKIDYIRSQAIKKEMTRYRNRSDVQKSARETVRKNIIQTGKDVAESYRGTYHSAMIIQHLSKDPSLKQELFDYLSKDPEVKAEPVETIKEIIVPVDQNGEVVL